jgi:uridylate kinase
MEVPGLAFAGESNVGIDAESLAKMVSHISAVAKSDIHLLVTVGFQNFQALVQHAELRTERYIFDATANLMAQVNAVVLYAELEKRGFQPKLLSERDVQTSEISEVYTPALATRYLAHEQIVLCNAAVDEGGLFDEDLSAVTRALDVAATALCKAVPAGSLAHLNPAAHGPVLINSQDLVVGTSVLPFSGAAAALCRTHRLPVVLFDPRSTISVGDALMQGVQAPDLVAVLR